MKTISERKKEKKFLLAAAAAVILILNIPAANSWVKNAFYNFAAPAQRPVWLASSYVGRVFGEFSSIRNAALENSRLREQVVFLQEQAAQVQYLKKENDLLHQALNLGLDKEYSLKESRIISKEVLRDVLIIDSGSESGVKIGDPAITLSKALVGRVVEVYPKFSKIMLSTSKESSFDVQAGLDLVDGLARGQGNFEMLMDLVSKEKNINIGDAVVTSSLGGIFPRGLVVGAVADVQKTDAQMFQKSKIIPAYDLGSLANIYVIGGFDSPESVLGQGAQKN